MSRREFHFQEGSSRKFWAIEVAGPHFTVQFGRLGTAGQTQTKEFADDAAARAAADKLIAEKTKKGYAEVAATAPPSASRPEKKTKGAGTPTSAAATPGGASPEVTRRIDVQQPDWLRLPGEPWRCRPKPPARPFDLRECLDRLERGYPSDWFRQGWKKCRIAPALVPAEARFWLEMMLHAKLPGKGTREDLMRWLADMDYEVPLPPKKIVARIKDELEVPTAEFAIPLVNLLPLEQFLDLVVGEQLVMSISYPTVKPRGYTIPSNLLQGFAEYVLPYLTEAEAESLRASLRERLDSSNSRFIHWAVAAYLGMSAELRAKVESWADDEFAKGISFTLAGGPHTILFNMGDSRLVEQHMPRVKLPLLQPDHVAAWLLHTRWHALAYVRDNILRVGRKDLAEKMTNVLGQVHAPEVAPHMLELKLSSKAPGPAGQWLDDNPGNAIAGLIPVAAGKGKLAEAAVECLRAAKKRGHADFIESQLKTAPAETAATIRQAVLGREEKVYEPLDARTTPKPLRDALAAAAPETKLPGWSAPALLPPILVGGRRLTDEQTSAVLGALRRTPLGTANFLLDSLKEYADPASLDGLAWRLFEQWLGEGAPSKEKWAFLALGRFGGDASVLKLTPLVRAWPGESQHARAVLGLECLRAVGSDTALMQLNGIAQKLKFQGLKNKAQEFMEAIAKDRGLSREELEDRIVPDLDLDERGGRDFDFGPRQFRLVLGSDLAPLVRDEAGKVKADLPKPGARDDAEKAAAAVEAWKLVKRQLREVLKVQAPRLEQAMVTGRRWPVEQFEMLLARHPLMTNLARRLLWAGYDAKGKPASLFRVTEEREYADADDKPLSLKGLASVGVVHPLHLTETQRAAWGQVFGDYEIIPPFPQLGRAVFSVEPNEVKAKTITRLAKIKLPTLAVRGTLDRLGWTRGSPANHGVILEFFKQFPAADVTAVLEVEPGIPMGAPDWAPEQEVKRVFFLRGLYQAVDYPYHKEETFRTLGKVDAVAVSEVLADLAALGLKGT